MRRSNLAFIFLFVLVSCSERNAPTLISSWKKKNKSPTIERRLANTAQGQCFKNNFTVDTLREQVKELESAYGNPPKVKGFWKHLDLSELPVPQANFLKTYGNMIGDQKNKNSIDYSSCTDVPCLFNKIYGKEDGVAGYVHYIWYLKFRNMLSADNVMPEDLDNYGKKKNEKVPGMHNGKSYELSSYLYNDDELYGFWRLSMMLKKPHTDLVYLEEIQRSPRGATLEGYGPGSCGLAYSGGWIKLSDGCLWLGPDKDAGYLYQSVTHELNHQYDFQLGRGTKEFYHSHQNEYLLAAGMYLNEYADSNGAIVRKWNLLPSAKLVTPYAATNPQENFAETLAVFRVEADVAKRDIAANHYNFVSQKYYSNETFDNNTLIKKWISQSSSEINKSAMKAVIDCSLIKNVTKSLFFGLNDFSSPILPAMLNCIGKKSEDIRDLLKDKISLTEPEGCKALSGKNVNNWTQGIKENLKATFEKYLNELQKDQDYVAKIQSYYNDLSDETIAMESYVNCYQERNEEACWTNQVKNQASKKGQDLNLSEDMLDEFVESYLSQHNYNQIKETTLQSYGFYIASNLEDVRISATKAWEGCHAINHNDDSSPTGNYFTVSGYLVSSFYNCLNAQIPESIKDVIKGYSSRDFELKNGKEEIILSDYIRPEFTKILAGLYGEEKNKETTVAQEFIVNNGNGVRRGVLSNLSWLSDITDDYQISNDCKNEAFKQISFLPLYHTKQDLFSEYVEQNVCYNVHEAPEFNKWVENEKSTYSKQIYSSLYDLTYNLAKDEANVCIGQYPMKNIFDQIRFKKHREQCLDNAWPRIEKKVIEKIMSDSLSSRLGITELEIKQKMSLNRKQSLDQVKREVFKVELDFGYEIPFQESFQSFL